MRRVGSRRCAARAWWASSRSSSRGRPSNTPPGVRCTRRSAGCAAATRWWPPASAASTPRSPPSSCASRTRCTERGRGGCRVALRVLTLNLWHDSGPWPRRAARIRDWLDRLDPDVVGFQEALRGPRFDQVAELLGERLPHRDYARASGFARAAEPLDFGNAVASRWPIAEREELRLPDRGDPETRAALWVGIEAPFGRLALTCTHLHWRFHHGDTRVRQVKEVALQAIRRRPAGGFPPVLLGDFNAEPESDEVRFV